MKPISWRRIGATVFIVVVITILAYLVWARLSAPPPWRLVPQPRDPREPIKIQVSVKGTVRDTAGNPVPYARVYLLHHQGGKDRMRWVDERIAGEAGEYHFDNISGFDARHPGRWYFFGEPSYTIIAEKPGYGLGCIRIVPTRDYPLADVPLHSEHTISGTVQDESGIPLVGAGVTLTSAKAPDASGAEQTMYFGSFSPYGYWPYGSNGSKPQAAPPPLIRFTDKNGRFVFPGLPSATNVGFEATMPRYFPDYGTSRSMTGDVTFALKRILVLKGRLIRTGTGLPLAHTNVVLLAGPGVVLNSTSTDSQGYFLFDYLREGSHELSSFECQLTTGTIHLNKENSGRTVVIQAH